MRQCVAFAVLVLMSGCIERFELEVARQPGKIIVQGLLTDHAEFQYVKLSKTTADEKIESVYGAIVEVEGNDETVHRFYEEEIGVYRPQETITLDTTLNYRLRVSLGDSSVVVSDWQGVPPQSGIDSAYYNLAQTRYFSEFGVEVTVHGFDFFVTTLPFSSEDTYLRYDYEEAYYYVAPWASPLCSECPACYIVEKSSDFVNTTSAIGSGEKALADYKFLHQAQDFEYSFRKTIRVLQFSLNKDVFQYYSAIQRQKELQGSIFDPPPGIIVNNLEDTTNPNKAVYGLFEVSRVAEAPIRVYGAQTPYDIESFNERCQRLSTADTYHPECSDCRAADNSTKIEPYWF